MFTRNDPRTMLQQRLNADSARVQSHCDESAETCGSCGCASADSSAPSERPIFQRAQDALKNMGLFGSAPPG